MGTLSGGKEPGIAVEGIGRAEVRQKKEKSRASLPVARVPALKQLRGGMTTPHRRANCRLPSGPKAAQPQEYTIGWCVTALPRTPTCKGPPRPFEARQFLYFGTNSSPRRRHPGTFPGCSSFIPARGPLTPKVPSRACTCGAAKSPDIRTNTPRPCRRARDTGCLAPNGAAQRPGRRCRRSFP
jgi:hypothetical protein